MNQENTACDKFQGSSGIFPSPLAPPTLICQKVDPGGKGNQGSRVAHQTHQLGKSLQDLGYETRAPEAKRT